MRRYSREEFSKVFDNMLGERLPGMPEQDVYVASAVQKYKLGSRFALKSTIDHRAWRYVQLGATTHGDGYAAYSGGLGLFATAVPSGALTIVRAVIGERTVTISAPTLVVDAYAGGLLTMFEVGQPILIMGIISNTATVITLDGPLPGTYTAGANANSQVIPGPYHEAVKVGVTGSAGLCFEPCVGVLNSPLDEDGNVVAAGDFVWLQTWGLCNMWLSAVAAGGHAGEREVAVLGDGACQIFPAFNDIAYNAYQRIGFLYSYTGADIPGENTTIDGTDVALMNTIIFLQIAP